MKGDPCPIPYCDRLIIAKDMCHTHYYRAMAGKNPEEPTNYEISEAMREWVVRIGCESPTNDHIIFPGRQDKFGYGKLGKFYAHRMVFAARYSDIDIDGQSLDHRPNCPKSCVNPEHLVPLTQGNHYQIESLRRGGFFIPQAVMGIITSALENFPEAEFAVLEALSSAGVLTPDGDPIGS